MIIDAHHHFWKYTAEDYGWMDDSMELLKRDFLPDDLAPLLKSSGVSGTLVVQARQSLRETRWLLKLAQEVPYIQGVIGWVDLCSPGVEEQLESFAGQPKLVGIRHVVHDEPDDAFLWRADFRRGIGQLQERGLVYDLLLFPKHLRLATKLVSALPGQRFVLDHLGKPPIKSGELQPWLSDISALASLPNVWCKLSGMVTEANRVSWKQEDFIPYVAAVLDCFGTERVMLGSDWPVCTLAGSYREVMGIALDYVSELSKTEQEQIYCRNAIECYQLQTKH